MRIICPTYWYPQHATDTQATYVHDINRHLARRGHSVTVVTPATSKPHHMVDNMTAAKGRLPDAAERKRMVDFISALQQA